MLKLWILLVSGFSCLVSAEEIDQRCELPVSLCKLQLNYESADADLNRVYKKIMNNIDSGELSASSLVDASELKTGLIASQRRWLDFKKANCDAFYTLNSRGSGRNEARMECEIEMTKARTEYLRSTY
jgi:uncharacterized protein YecT (DUF1311 family)